MKAFLRIPFFLAFAACATQKATVSAPAAPAPSQYEIAADAAANEALAEGAPGLTVAIAHGGQTVLTKAYGIADVENGVSMTRDSVLRIGSLTKQFTAAAVMQLVEQGKLALDDTLQKWIPEFETQGKRVTIEHLLHHTSGIKNYGDLEWSGKRRTPLTLAQLVTLMQDQLLDFEPGAKWRYSNTNYYLLGRIVEKASGLAYADYLRDHVLLPAGLTATRYCDDRTIIPKRTRGYTRAKAEGLINAEPVDIEYAFAAGGLCSTAEELIRWNQALTSGKVVSLGSYQRMIRSDKLADGRNLNYGFGLLMMKVAGHDAILHGGGINGFGSFLSAYPNDGYVMAVILNTDALDPQAQEQRIASRLFARNGAKP
jgi:CubicO group peptidase (beta-lactamase class C family)